MSDDDLLEDGVYEDGDVEGEGIEELDLQNRDTTKDDRLWGMILHLSTLSGTIIPIPFAGVVVPLIIWLTKKEGSRFLDHQGREVLNFQITVLLGVLISIPLMFVIVGFITLAAVIIISLVLTIMAAIKANEGVWYTYPWSIRFIKPAPLPEV